MKTRTYDEYVVNVIPSLGAGFYCFRQEPLVETGYMVEKSGVSRLLNPNVIVELRAETHHSEIQSDIVFPWKIMANKPISIHGLWG